MSESAEKALLVGKLMLSLLDLTINCDLNTSAKLTSIVMRVSHTSS